MSSETVLPRRLLLRTLLCTALGGAVGVARANDTVVWLVPSDRGDAYDEAAAALRADLPGATWRVQSWASLPTIGPNEPAPRLIVTLGSNAYRAVLERGSTDAALQGIPIVAGLLPRASFEAVPLPRNAPPVSAIWLDPAVDRYLELIRRTMPDRLRVGVVFGPTSRALRPQVVKAAYDRGLELVEASVSADALYPALAQVLREADVLLALPDPVIYNANTLNNVLIAAYRQRVPIVTYASSQVRAGATMALHVTPSTAGKQLAGLVRRALTDRRNLPPPSPSNDWVLAVNQQVARSLGITIGDTDTLLAALRRSETRP